MAVRPLRGEVLFAPLHDRAFRWFFIGRSVSVIGSSMAPIALAFAVLGLTGSAGALSFVLTAYMVPMLVFLIVGGGVADRFRRDTLLRLTNLLSGLVQGGMALAIITHQDLTVLIGLSILNGTVEAFTRPASAGIIAQLVDRDNLQQANSLLATTRNLAKILGPTLAGILVATVGGGWALIIDAASFLFAALCLSAVSLPDRPVGPESGLLREIRLGWSYFRATSWLWSVTGTFAVINAVQLGVWQVLGPVIADDTIGANGWGVVLSARAVGMLAMGVAMAKLRPRRPMVSGLVWLAVTAAPLFALGAGAAFWPLFVGGVLSGCGFTYVSVLWDTVRQREIPENMLSRAVSYDELGSFGTIPLGQLSVVPLAAAFGAGPVALCGAGLYVLASVLPLAFGSVRRIGTTVSPTDSRSAQARPPAR